MLVCQGSRVQEVADHTAWLSLPSFQVWPAFRGGPCPDSWRRQDHGSVFGGAPFPRPARGISAPFRRVCGVGNPSQPRGGGICARRRRRAASTAKHRVAWADVEDPPGRPCSPPPVVGAARGQWTDLAEKRTEDAKEFPLRSLSPRLGGVSSLVCLPLRCGDLSLVFSPTFSSTSSQTSSLTFADAAVQTDVRGDGCGEFVLQTALDARLKDSERAIKRAAVEVVKSSFQEFANEFATKSGKMHDAVLEKAAEVVDTRFLGIEKLGGRVQAASDECAEFVARVAALENVVEELAVQRANVGLFAEAPVALAADPGCAAGYAVRLFGPRRGTAPERPAWARGGPG